MQSENVKNGYKFGSTDAADELQKHIKIAKVFLKYIQHNASKGYYTPCPEKSAAILFAITLPNPNRSSKFFYRHTQQ